MAQMAHVIHSSKPDDPRYRTEVWGCLNGECSVGDVTINQINAEKNTSCKCPCCGKSLTFRHFVFYVSSTPINTDRFAFQWIQGDANGTHTR